MLPKGLQVIHYKDPVPHVPPLIDSYKRLPTEVWYSSRTDTKSWECCPSAGGEEDKHCSDKYDVFDNVEDHLHYLGHYTGCT